MKGKLSEEHNAEIQESNRSQKISQIISWIGTNNTFCSENYEHNDVIKKELNISSFASLQSTLLNYDDKNSMIYITYFTIFIQ